MKNELDMEIIQNDWKEEWDEKLGKAVVTITKKTAYSPALSLKNIGSIHYGKLNAIDSNIKMFEKMISDLKYEYKNTCGNIKELNSQIERSANLYKTYVKNIGSKVKITYPDMEGNLRTFDVKPREIKKNIKQLKIKIGESEKKLKKVVEELRKEVDGLQV